MILIIKTASTKTWQRTYRGWRPRMKWYTAVSGLVSLVGWTGKGILRYCWRCHTDPSFMLSNDSLFHIAFGNAKRECWNKSRFPHIYFTLSNCEEWQITCSISNQWTSTVSIKDKHSLYCRLCWAVSDKANRSWTTRSRASVITHFLATYLTEEGRLVCVNRWL